MTQEWLEQVAAVLRKGATEPFFPGDPDPLFPILEKLVNKLYEKCFNDDEVGTDGCPVCRAWRTEKAESQAQKVEAALAEEVKKSLALGLAKAEVERHLNDLATASSLQDTLLRNTAKDLKKSQAQWQSEAGARAVAEAQAKQLAADLEAAKSALDTVSQDYAETEARLDKLHKVLGEL